MATPASNVALQTQLMTAISAHGAWKARLSAAVQSGKIENDPAVVAKDDACAFGQWLHKGADAVTKANPNFAKTKELHAKFHKEAARLLQLIAAGKVDAARQELSIKSPFMSLSSELTMLLGGWHKSLK